MSSRTATWRSPTVTVWDGWLLSALVVLLSLGLVLVYSSSAVYAERQFGNAEFFLHKQLLLAGLGLAAMFVLAQVPRHWLEDNAGWVFLAAVGLCVLVLIPGLGVFRGGARRWLDVGLFTFQPSEVAKLAVVLLLARILSRRDTRPTARRCSLWVPVLVAQVPVVFVLVEPDLGTALVMEMLVATLVFAAGVRPRTLVVLALLALPVFYHLVVGTPFRLRRILGYIDPWAYRSTVGYQITEALIAIGSGGVWGVGLGQGTHRLFFLPEAHTDFIFAILAEELGLVGVTFFIIALGLLLHRGLSLATRAQVPFDRYLALGVTALIGIPALLNLGVVTGLLPTKGLPLPLISYGGTNLAVALGAVGMLLRIDRDVRSLETGSEP